MLDVVKQRFEDDISRYDQGDFVPAAKMSTDISVGHALLTTSNALLRSGITDSMIKLINADEDLYESNVSLQLFVAALEQIRDWDDAVNVWAVNPEQSALNPYVNLLVRSTAAQVKLAGYMGIGEAGNQRARSLMREIDSLFRTIRRHNSDVIAVLYSYEPTKSTEITDLMSLLKSNGLFQVFSQALSIANTASNIMKSDAIKTGIANRLSDVPTYGACREAYPDLFRSDPNAEISRAQALDVINAPPASISEAALEHVEKIESHRMQVLEQSQNLSLYSTEPQEMANG
jgi:hypothetical protein